MASVPTISIQFLEDSPSLVLLNEKQVVEKLRQAAERVKFSHLLVGWNVPPRVLEACRREAERLGMRFLRWQPLLAGDRDLQTRPDWLTVGLGGSRVMGYQARPEFTFLCPNHPAVQEAVSVHLDRLIHQGLYQGFFLDRVRFPSPSADPIRNLACFCEHCRRSAEAYGLDMERIRFEILRCSEDEIGRITLVQSILSGNPAPDSAEGCPGLAEWLDFRLKSVQDFLAPITLHLRKSHQEIGLDCFSPCLAHMVGQDISALRELVDWVKLMTYTRTFAPAGIPFELSGLVRYITATTHHNEQQALELLGRMIRLPLPSSLDMLEGRGLPASAYLKEVMRGVEACSAPVLAGLELVKVKDVTHQTPARIRASLNALRQANPAGLAVSWDLRFIPLDWLELVGELYPQV